MKTLHIMEKSFSVKLFGQTLLKSFLILFVLNTASFGQSRESLIKAGYVEKFTHFVQWPKDLNTGDFQNIFYIGIIGENTFGKALSEIFDKIKVMNNPVEITTVTSYEQISNCRIIFISASEKNNLEKILKYTSGKPILTISDSKGFGQKGVIINMFQEGNYIRYEINQVSLDKSGLIINSLLLNYAVIIGTNG